MWAQGDLAGLYPHASSAHAFHYMLCNNTHHLVGTRGNPPTHQKLERGTFEFATIVGSTIGSKYSHGSTRSQEGGAEYGSGRYRGGEAYVQRSPRCEPATTVAM